MAKKLKKLDSASKQSGVRGMQDQQINIFRARIY